MMPGNVGAGGGEGRPPTASPEPWVQVLVGIGSNMGERESHLRGAVVELASLMELQGVSSVYESAPEGPADQRDYLNVVVRARTTLDPLPLLDGLLEMEKRAGRVRTRAQGPRPLDLDLLFYGDRQIQEDRLVVPHPRWRSRSFVVIPLLEVAPDFVDPHSRRTVRELVHPADDLRASLTRIGALRLPATVREPSRSLR